MFIPIPNLNERLSFESLSKNRPLQVTKDSLNYYSRPNLLIPRPDAEMSVDGVYLRMFINNPGWALKRPKEFTIALLETWASLASQPAPPVSQSEITGGSHGDCEI